MCVYFKQLAVIEHNSYSVSNCVSILEFYWSTT